MMKALFLRNEIDMISLLSSTTYRTNQFDECIYCHSLVENDFYEYEGENIGMPFRCTCNKAKEELLAKETLLKKIIDLQSNIDVEYINKITKQYMVDEIERAYEENSEYPVLSML